MPVPWTVKLQLTSDSAKILAVDRDGSDVLKARLPVRPGHPRALLTLLEGLALWSGRPLCAAISVADDVAPSLDSDFFDGELWPEESALVHFVFVGPVRPSYRLSGVGDFRSVRRGVAPEGGHR